MLKIRSATCAGSSSLTQGGSSGGSMGLQQQAYRRQLAPTLHIASPSQRLLVLPQQPSDVHHA